MCFEQILQIVNIGLIGLTVFFLWRYTRATKKLMQSSVEHNEILTRPFISAVAGLADIVLRNGGNGTAIIKSISDTEIAGITLPDFGFDNQTMLMSFDIKEYILGPQQKLKYGFEGRSDNPEFDEFIKNESIQYFGFPFFKYGVKEYRLTVEYENILNQGYTSHFTVDCKKRRIKLTGFEKE